MRSLTKKGLYLIILDLMDDFLKNIFFNRYPSVKTIRAQGDMSDIFINDIKLSDHLSLVVRFVLYEHKSDSKLEKRFFIQQSVMNVIKQQLMEEQTLLMATGIKQVQMLELLKDIVLCLIDYKQINFDRANYES